MKKIFAFLITLIVLLGLSTTAYAESSSVKLGEYEKSDLKKITFSSPINMYIYDENGDELAFLTSEGYGSSKGLSPKFFYGIGRQDGGWDYTAYIPYGCSAKILGYTNTTLRIYMTDEGLYGKNIIQILGDIPINSKSEGVLKINNKGEASLIVDDKKYPEIIATEFKVNYGNSKSNVPFKNIIFVIIFFLETITIIILVCVLSKHKKCI